MARKLALINMKGGVGKSTLAANLAWEMASEPWYKRVLVIDLDPQFNCSQYLIGTQRMEHILSSGSPTVWDVFEQHTVVPGKPSIPLDPADTLVRVHPRTRQTTNSGLIDLMPSRLELSQTLRNPTSKEHLLKQTVDRLEARYDLVIIDCAPTDSILTTSAYLVADYIMVPVRPQYLSTIGLPLLERSLVQFASQYSGSPPRVLGIVFNAVSRSNQSPESRKSQQEVRQVANQSGWPVFTAEVAYSESFPRGARDGTPILNTTHARQDMKNEFFGFAQEFALRIGL